MILSSYVETKITNQGKYYASLGYSPTKQGTVLLVKTEHLPKNSNIKVQCKCDICNIVFQRQYQLLIKNNKLYVQDLCKSCSRKTIGRTMDRTNIDLATKERIGIKHPRWNPNKTEFKLYYSIVKRISEQNYRDFKSIINPDNLSRNLCGVEGGYQLDHKISIKYGFDNNLDPYFIGSIDNLQMLTWLENRNKHF